METSLRLENSWEEVKEMIKESNLEITDADLELNPGKEDELYERLAQKLHRNKQEIKEWIESISANKVIAG